MRRAYESLSIVTIDGFKPEDRIVKLDDGSTLNDGPEIDAPGTANYLCTLYGMAPDGEFSPDADGILWTDYECYEGWRFTVLIDSREVDSLRETAEGAGYTVLDVEEIDVPTNSVATVVAKGM